MAKNKSKINWVVWVLIAILLYGGSQGWFKKEGDVFNTVNNQDILNQLEQPQTETEVCTLTIAPGVTTAGDTVRGTIRASPRVFCETYVKYLGVWQKVWAGNTDITGAVSDTEEIHLIGDFIFKSICGTCITNDALLTVNPSPDAPRCVDSDGEDRFTFGHVEDTELMIGTPDECLDGDTVIEQTCPGPDLFASVLLDCPTTHECTGGRCVEKSGVGDVVGGSSGSGTLPSGDGGASWDLDLSSVETGGPCRLGARIYTNWNYVDADSCFGFVAQEGIEWNFFDSAGLQWQAIDATPQAHSVDLCPLSWNGMDGWILEMWRMWDVPNCEIEYTYDVEVYLCECDD